MGKLLKITKADKTTHTAPLGNRAFYEGQNNNILPKDKQWKIEEIDEKDAAKLDFIDESYVTGAEAVEKISGMEEELARLRAENASLKGGANGTTSGTTAQNQSVGFASDPAQAGSSLNKLGAGTLHEPNDGQLPALKGNEAFDTVGGDAKTDSALKETTTAAELIQMIDAATTPDEVMQLAGTDTRTTVQTAVSKKINKLNQGAQ